MSQPIELTEEFERALHHLNSGSHLFLTGKAGTGKSTLVRHYMETTERKVVVAAPTGIAALNVNGYTLHRLLSFSTTTTLADVQGPNYFPGRFAKAIKGMDTLIIDEASMVRADLLDMVEAALRRFGPHPGRPFGGVQIVLVGDLFQLPPVVTPTELAFFSTRYRTEFFFSADCFDRSSFPTVALTKVFRQIGDYRLTSILNAVREGVLLDQAKLELEARVMPGFEPPEDEFWLTLAPTNRVVMSRNNHQLAALAGDEHQSIARKTGDLELLDTSSVEETLRFKEGAQVMMVTNDPGDRWVNGTLGRIASVDAPEEPLVTVEFRDGSAAQVGLHTWDVTRPVVEGVSLRHEVVGTFSQLPFKLAWAITIHKSQGQTLDNLIVDLAGGAFASGQVYVALSRCTSTSGLVLKQPLRPRDLNTDRRVLRFMQEATSDSGPARYCSVATLSVGSVGRMWRPRPVEIAVAFDDGSALSTLVNPCSDLYNARDDFGITVGDILLAPTLAEVWSVLGVALEGWVPVGVDIDATLAHIDYELKRNGSTVSLPVGISIPEDSLTDAERSASRAPSALGRATAQLTAFQRLKLGDPTASRFKHPQGDTDQVSFLLTRDSATRTPQPERMPMLDALAQVSRELSAILLNGLSSAEARGADAALASVRNMVGQVVAARVRASGPLPKPLADRLPDIDDLLGTALAQARLDSATDAPRIDDVLAPGAVFCISGSPHTPDGRSIEKSEIGELAARFNVTWTDKFGKKTCDALIVAEEGTQSGKAKKAAMWGTPVFGLDQLWLWLDSEPNNGGTALLKHRPPRMRQAAPKLEHERPTATSPRPATTSPARHGGDMEELQCQLCGGSFVRPLTRGRKPLKCPDCSPQR